MSSDKATSTAAEPTAKEGMFFYHILTSNKVKLEVDWEQVATKCGYSNGGTAAVRFRQVKKRLGLAGDGAAPAATGDAAKIITPRKPRIKKEVGSGTNKTPSKVTKARTPKKSPTKAAEAQLAAGFGDEEIDMEEEDLGYGGHCDTSYFTGDELAEDVGY